MRKLFENWRGFITEELRATYVSNINQAYSILGLQPNAPMSTAKTAFRKLAKKVHPDKNPNNPEASREFQKAREAWGAIQDPDNFKFAPAGAASGEAGPTSGPEAVKGMWDSATQRDPSARIILASLMKIKSQAEEAIRGGKSIKRQGVSLPAEIVISNSDFNNLKDFMNNYQWEYFRNTMGGEQFVKDKILRTLKDVPYSTKFGSGKQDLQTFVQVLSRALPPPSEEKQEEPAKKRKPGEWQDAPPMSPEEEAKLIN